MEFGEEGLVERIFFWEIFGWEINRRMKGIKGFKGIYNLKKKSIKVPNKIGKVPGIYQNAPISLGHLSGRIKIRHGGGRRAMNAHPTAHLAKMAESRKIDFSFRTS